MSTKAYISCRGDGHGTLQNTKSSSDMLGKDGCSPLLGPLGYLRL